MSISFRKMIGICIPALNNLDICRPLLTNSNMCKLFDLNLLLCKCIMKPSVIFSSSEPEAYLWAYSISRSLSYTYVCVLSTFSNISSETTCRLKPNFMWILLGMGQRKFIKMVQVTWPRWPSCPYMVKTFKIFSFGTKRPMTLKLGMQNWVLEYYQVCPVCVCSIGKS